MDGFLGHVGREVVVLLSDPWEDLRMIAEQIRLPLIGFASQKPIEGLEFHTGWPLFERPGRTAVLESLGVMVLAEPRTGVAILLQDLGHGGIFRADDGVVARETRRPFPDDAEPDGMVVAAGDKCCPRRRA